ncbi:hypothetical protein Cyagr_2031 [Cyanobium gracile PCC 6307]|uniref:Uncharacterized protein n=1 Tax=Cyanobium gracile (strain ATCC 27147 / PCC 6307) TaxID=292564 RepID=K9P9A1_CYAGP|nr:hypothetical protein Cyagr_2031 [Cyanobium gracile PCC 6307]
MMSLSMVSSGSCLPMSDVPPSHRGFVPALSGLAGCWKERWASRMLRTGESVTRHAEALRGQRRVWAISGVAALPSSVSARWDSCRISPDLPRWPVSRPTGLPTLQRLPPLASASRPSCAPPPLDSWRQCHTGHPSNGYRHAINFPAWGLAYSWHLLLLQRQPFPFTRGICHG